MCTLVLFLLVALGLLTWDRSELYSEAFQQRIIAEVARQLHWELKVQHITIKPLKGVDLIKVAVSSKEIRPNQFLKAEKLRLRYNLWDALAKRRIILEEFRLDAPAMEIDLSPPASNPNNPPTNSATSASSNPSQGATVNTATSSVVQNPTTPVDQEQAIQSLPPAPPQIQRTSQKGTFWPAPQPIDLRKILIDDGIFSFTLPTSDQIFMTGTHIEASLSADPVPTGAGTIICQSSRIAKKVQLSDSRCNFLWRGDTLSVPKITASTFNGVIDGSLNADQSKPTGPFEIQVVATNLSVQEIIQTFDENRRRLWGDVHGNAQTRMRFQGSMIDPVQTSGQGIIQITDCRVFDSVPIVLLAGLINRPDLKELKPQKCEMDFILQSTKLQIPRIEVLSPDIQLTGNGWINFTENTVDFQLKLAVSPAIAERLPKELVQEMDQRGDGYREKGFRVWGPKDNPQNDLVPFLSKVAIRAIGGSIFDNVLESIKKQVK